MTDLNNIVNLAEGESDVLDFKESFTGHTSDLLELIKDIIAMANSGGGKIVFGINDNGELGEKDITPIFSVDPADITNKIFSFTGVNFGGFKIIECNLNTTNLALIQVDAIYVPIVFVKPGNYQSESGKQKNVFSVGSVYFRHGAKSEPCTSDDLRNFLEREITRTKESWLNGIRQVVEAPEGSRVLIVPNNTEEEINNSTYARLVNDENAPVLRLEEKDYFALYPFGYTQLTAALKIRYSNFSANNEFHQIRKPLLDNPRYCKTRLLNPNSAKSSKIILYSKYIFEEFDKHYSLKETS